MSDAMQISIGGRFGVLTSPSTITNQIVDLSNDGVGWVFQARSADAITHLGFRYGVATGTPPTFIIALESADATGLPDGTVLGGGTPASATFTPPADTTWNGTIQWIALANAYTPTRGQTLAITIRYSSGTIDGTNNSSFSYRIAAVITGDLILPYPLTLTAGTWAKAVSGLTLMGYRTAIGRYGHLLATTFTTTVATTGFRSTSRLTLPAGWGSTYQVVGARLGFAPPATGGSFKLGLWDGTTEIQSATVDTDHLGVNSGTRVIELFFTTATLAALTFGGEYRLGFEVIGSLAIGIRGFQLTEANDRLMYPAGTQRGYSSWNGSAWSDDDTVLPFVEWILDDITEPTGGSGLARIIGG